MFSSRAYRLVSGISAMMACTAMLSGCITDTTSMNVDRFRQETAPVFYQQSPSEPTTRAAARPAKAGIGVSPSIYQTEFHQTYGLPVSNPMYLSSYGPMNDDGRSLPAIPYKQIDAKYLRQEVDYQTTEKPGTIVVETEQRFLYLVQPGGRAIRYGVGLGREGFAWSGRGTIQWKQKWPRWTPPQDMVERTPDLRRFAAANGGMNPGLLNPLGARAMYIFKDGKDTMYRVHGTPEWKSIGRSTSSGCVRMLNQDVIDLYNHVGEKATIVVK